MAEPLPVRRMGSEVIHMVPEARTYTDRFVVDYTRCVAPAETVCGAMLRGNLVVMTKFTRHHVCSRCLRRAS